MIRVAAASVDITPERALELGGSWSRRGPLRSTGVDEALEANLALIESPLKRVILLSIDTLIAGPDLARDLAQRCADNGYPAQVFVLATHTHWAPMLDRGKPFLGLYDNDWYGEVVGRLATAADRAHQSLQPGLLVSTACADISGSVGRRSAIQRPVLYGRRIKSSGTLMGPNSRAPRAPACRVAILRQAGGAIVCVLASWACHPADRPAPDRISPDYVGTLRRSIRSLLGCHPVLFLQGFSGDVRADISIEPTLRTSMRRLVRGPVFMTPSMKEWERWARSVGAQISEVAKTAAERPATPARTLRAEEASVSLSTLLGTVTPGACRACSLAIGDTLTLFMVSAEVSAAYADAVERLGAWPVGYLDDVFGYLPTDAQLPAGGYEVEDFRRPYGIQGRFTGHNDAAFAYLLTATLVNSEPVTDPSAIAFHDEENGATPAVLPGTRPFVPQSAPKTTLPKLSDS